MFSRFHPGIVPASCLVCIRRVFSAWTITLADGSTRSGSYKIGLVSHEYFVYYSQYYSALIKYVYGHPIVQSSHLSTVLGGKASSYEHYEGQLFKTPDDATLAFGLMYWDKANNKSGISFREGGLVKTGREYATNIYAKDVNGKTFYYYSDVYNCLGHEGVVPILPLLDVAAGLRSDTRVAMAHIHPSAYCDCCYPFGLSPEDTQWADKKGLGIFAYTQRGRTPINISIIYKL